MLIIPTSLFVTVNHCSKPLASAAKVGKNPIHVQRVGVTSYPLLRPILHWLIRPERVRDSSRYLC
jgi:hypothetical protein